MRNLMPSISLAVMLQCVLEGIKSHVYGTVTHCMKLNLIPRLIDNSSHLVQFVLRGRNRSTIVCRHTRRGIIRIDKQRALSLGNAINNGFS